MLGLRIVVLYATGRVYDARILLGFYGIQICSGGASGLGFIKLFLVERLHTSRRE